MSMPLFSEEGLRMCHSYISLDRDNLAGEHLCCAISDKKHQDGVELKKAWLSERIPEGHVFRKLDARGKVFIEYAPLETAWVPVTGDNFFFIYCFWVSGSFKNKGHGKSLLAYCIEDARKHGRSGVCVISSKKKKPYLTDKKYMLKYGFEVVDAIGDYELLALSFDGQKPTFSESARRQAIEAKELTIYYSRQCPCILDCVRQVERYCSERHIPLNLIQVDSLEKAKAVPGVFNNYAVFYQGRFLTLQLLNEGHLKKVLAQNCDKIV